jgi:hypothetical protein
MSHLNVQILPKRSPRLKLLLVNRIRFVQKLLVILDLLRVALLFLFLFFRARRATWRRLIEFNANFEGFNGNLFGIYWH